MWFSLFRAELYIYDLAGRDSSAWINRILWKIGEEPVLYSPTKAIETQRFLRKIMQSKGYNRKEEKKENQYYLLD